jgi:hypothetical protein
MTGDTYATDEQKAQRVDDIMRRVEALPGVVAAFASNFVPLDAGGGAVMRSSTAAPHPPEKSRPSSSLR